MRNKENWARALRADEFELLCLDGTRMPVDQYKKCNLGKVKGRAMVTASKSNLKTRAGSPFRGALGNLGVRGHQTPSLPPNPPSNNPFTTIFYTPFLNL